jgi:hypothetical protein
MRKSNHHELRELLRSHPDGLTIKQMCAHTGKLEDSTRQSLKSMPDVYIDRWHISGTKPAAVYIAVPVPDDCPAPDIKPPRSRL